VSNNACGTKPVIARIVIDFEIRGRSRARRKAHRRNNWRKSSFAICKRETRNVQNRRECIAAARNECTAECRIQEIFLSQSPRKNLPCREKSIGNAIFNTVCAGDQINFVDNNSASKKIYTADKMRIHGRFDHMTPTSKIALDLRPDETGTVLQR